MAKNNYLNINQESELDEDSLKHDGSAKNMEGGPGSELNSEYTFHKTRSRSNALNTGREDSPNKASGLKEILEKRSQDKRIESHEIDFQD